MKAAYLMSSILIISVLLIYFFQAAYMSFIHVFSNMFPPFIAGSAVIVSGVSLRKYWGNPKDKFSKIWLCFTLGMGFWFLGEVAWTVYTFLFNIAVPYPSIADLLWLVGYVPLIVALQLYIHTFRYAISKAMYVVTAAAVSIAGFVLFAFLALPVLAVASENDAATLIVDLVYPALDLSLFSMSFRSLLIFAKGKIAQAWMFINAAVLMVSVADILFSFTTLHGTYYNGHPLELFFHMSYLFFALGFYTHSKEF